jgi:hypothetical protein
MAAIMDTPVEVSAAVDGDAEPNSSAKREMRQEDRMAESPQLTMFGHFTAGDALFHNPPYRTASRSTAIIGFFFLTGLCAAQMTTRGLSGTVTNGHNEPLTGAVIQIQNGATTSVISNITGRDGRYTFKRLDGQTDYRLWARFKGQQSKVRKLSQFDSDKPKVIDFVIRPRP